MDSTKVADRSISLARQRFARFILILILSGSALSFCLSACTSMQKSSYSNTIEENASFKLAAEQPEYGSDVTQIHYSIQNDSGDEAIFGVAYELDVHLDGTWYAVPFKGVNGKTQPTWPAIAYIIPAHGDGPDMVIDLSTHEGIKPGEYRLIKEINLRSGEQTRIILAETFTINIDQSYR
jgi:hypothetical protein